MKAAPTVKSPILPLPASVIAHHLETLLPWFESWKKQSSVPPVLLLTGIEGVGKRSMSYWISQWLLCEKGGFSNTSQDMSEETQDLFGGELLVGLPRVEDPPSQPPSQGPCGSCRSCKKALQSSWVDFREIGASSEDEGQDSDRIKLDAFRELKTSAGFGALESSYRIFLIRDADRMTPQAANSLLKILEEPPPSWLFILTATDSSLLLPTLVSRCQRIRLKPFAEPTLRELLLEAGVPSERVSTCLHLAQGSWKKALSLGDEGHWEKREQVLRFLENPPEQLNAVLEWASSSAESLQQLLDLLEPLQLQLLQWSASASGLQSPHSFDRFLTSHLKYAAMHLRDLVRVREFWMNRAERLAKARHEITLPLNKKLLTQEILLPYLLS